MGVGQSTNGNEKSNGKKKSGGSFFGGILTGAAMAIGGYYAVKAAKALEKKPGNELEGNPSMSRLEQAASLRPGAPPPQPAAQVKRTVIDEMVVDG